MFTQCPKCQTVFHITMAQLQTRRGIVRCGHCDHVFNADQRLFDEIPGKAPTAAKQTAKKTAAPTKKARAPKAEATTRRATRPDKSAATEAAAGVVEVTAAPAPWSPPTEGIAQKKPRRPTKPAAELEPELLLPRAPLARRFSFLWVVGSIVLTLAFFAQAIYFYRDALARDVSLRPFIIDLCEPIGCTVRLPYDANQIELIPPTKVAPHPRIVNALRLRATMVNRASQAQAKPLLQLTLTDSNGHVLARRSFTPQEYLEQPATAGTDMPPNLAIGILLDVTSPDSRAGYQIEFLPPPPQ